MPVAPSRTRRASSRGQSLVELALIAPVFLILLMTAIDLGRLMYSQITITNAAKEAALVASQGGTWQANQPCSDTNTVMCGAISEAQAGFVIVEQTRVTLTPATCDPNEPYPAGGPPTVSVEVNSPFNLLTPIVGSIVGSNIVLHSTAEAECLAVPAVTFPSIPLPTATFTASPASGTAPLPVSFDASGSSSPGGTIKTYTWSFGAVETDAFVTHVFTSAGTYPVVLTVTDSRNQTASFTGTINVTGSGPTPTPGVTCPTISFTWDTKGADKNPHRVNLDANLSSSAHGPWGFAWSGPGVSGNKQKLTVDFPNPGPYEVTITATNAAGTCSVSSTQTVVAT